MPSRYENIWTALKNHLEAYPNKPSYIAYPGESFDPPTDAVTPYWIVEALNFDPLRVYYGSDCPNWQTGSLIINCMCVLQWSSTDNATWAGELADYFKQDTPMISDGLEIRVSNQPLISSAGFRDGSRWRLPVSIPFEGWV